MPNTIHGRAGQFLALLFAIPMFLAACAQTQVVDSWQTEEAVSNKPDKVAVIVVLPDSLQREVAERDVTRILSDKGIPAVAASQIKGMGGGIRGEIDVEVATGLLRSAEVDGVIAMFFSGATTRDYQRNDYRADYVGTYWGPYWVGGTDVYTVYKGGERSSLQTSVYIEAGYYDLDSKQPVWRIVTRTKDAEHTDVARDVAQQVVSEMRKAGLN